MPRMLIVFAATAAMTASALAQEPYSAPTPGETQQSSQAPSASQPAASAQPPSMAKPSADAQPVPQSQPAAKAEPAPAGQSTQSAPSAAAAKDKAGDATATDETYRMKDGGMYQPPAQRPESPAKDLDYGRT